MTIQEKQQLREIKSDLCTHVSDQKIHDKATDGKLDKLMPLADLIPAIEKIVAEKQIELEVNKKIAKIVASGTKVVLFIGAFIGATFAIIQLIFRLEK